MKTKKLDELLDQIFYKEVCGNRNTAVTGIEYDSRRVKSGNIFVAIAGYKKDGNVFIKNALDAGAAVIVSSTKPDTANGDTLVLVDNPRLALALMSAAFYEHPSDFLNVIGITGTNGKTTVSYVIESILKANKNRPGVFGTVEYRLGDKVLPAPNTTPQSKELQEMLYELHDKGFDAAVMEVSSHALMQERVEGIEFDAAVFTNLTRDHLDFHKTMEDYLNAKSRLFSGLGKANRKKREKIAVINNDDKYAEKLKSLTQARVVTYAVDSNADITARGVKLSVNGAVFFLKNGLDGTDTKISMPLIGKHNVYNALAAATVAIGQGIPLEIIKEGIEGVQNIPGRFEVIDEGQPFTVIVDFAHTDDSLKRVIEASRQLEPRRIITVFGCGGDRDRGKRPLMGEIAVKKSDYVIVTSDNPRSEDPDKITLDIEVGIKQANKDNYRIIVNRNEAIRAAIKMAAKGDMIILAGKGHEHYQIIGDSILYFNDGEEARKALKQLNKNGKNEPK
jgi:UDP-N-acetylmuramoyl-L-alanyl-D-glutamate--2,6-diaminopimelate ligase